MKVKREDLGYVALLACILNDDFITSPDLLSNKKNNSDCFKIDEDLKNFIADIQFI